MTEEKCVICQADFRADGMVGDKCKPCAKLYPDAKSKADLKSENKKIATLLSESRVEEIVYNILEAANIKRVKCERCGALFFKNSPAQKFCKNCSKLEGAEK